MRERNLPHPQVDRSPLVPDLANAMLLLENVRLSSDQGHEEQHGQRFSLSGDVFHPWSHISSSYIVHRRYTTKCKTRFCLSQGRHRNAMQPTSIIHSTHSFFFPPSQSPICSIISFAAVSGLCCRPIASTKSPSGSIT